MKRTFALWSRALCKLYCLSVAGFLAFTGLPVFAGDDVAQWPQFRGPLGDGHAPTSSLPLQWSDQPNAAQNILWKTAVHDRGWSSPVIWGSQVWVTTGTRDGRQLFAVCLDKETGKVLHDLRVFEVEKPDYCAPSNSYASPTSVIEPGRLYVHYGTNGTACIDTEKGQVLWTRRDLPCEHEQGAGSSPILWNNLLIFHVDGRDVQYVIALDKTTGATVWKTPRSIDYSRYEVYQRKGYCTPIVIPHGDRQQLISPGAKAVFSYDIETGKELWKVRHEGWSMTPRPLFGHGLIFAVVDYDHPQLWALRPDGTGDVTESHIVWKATTGIPSRASPLLIGDHLYLVTADGVASCLEAITGQFVWKQRLGGKYSASPVTANGRIYFFNEDSVTTVIKAGPKFESLATNALTGDPLMASPAAVDGSLFLRTEGFVYRIGAPRPAAATRAAPSPNRSETPNAKPDAKPAETVFSGPQVGEKLSKFSVQGVFDDAAGKTLDFVAQAKGKPIVLIFVHDVNRQSIALTRILSQYTSSRAKDGLATGVVWLVDDATEGEAMLKRMRHALAPKAPIGISLDGREGPGSYGLNRNVTLTILVGKGDQVTANFALIQPSLQVDLPKILKEVVAVAGGSVPKLEELEGMPQMTREAPAGDSAPNLRPLLAPLIRRNATDDEVDKAAQEVEKQAKADAAVRREVGRIARTIIDAGKLTDYGTARAQEYLTKWSKEFGRPVENKR